MTKFKLQPGETILKKGPMTSFEGELGFMNVLSGRTKVTPCVGFLTSARFAACSRLAVFPWGPLVWLVLWLMGRKILFEVSLGDITSITRDETAGNTFVIHAADGSSHRVCSDTFFDQREKWIEAIRAASPAVTVEPSGKV